MAPVITGPQPGELSSEEVIALVDFKVCPEGTTHWSALSDGRHTKAVWLQMAESGDIRVLADAPGFNVPIAGPLPGQRHRQIVVRRGPQLIIPPSEHYARELERAESERLDRQLHSPDEVTGEPQPQTLYWNCESCADNFSYVIVMELGESPRMVIRCTKCKAIQEDLVLGVVVPADAVEEDEAEAPPPEQQQ